jgi:hypothetical protein
MKFRAKAMEEDGEDFEDDAPAKALALVRAVPRLQWDIDALASLMSASEPLVHQIRCKKSLKAYYGFGDASGYAFGGSIQAGEDLWYEYGQWSTDVEENSSNWRELANLVNFIERSLKQHELAGSELFIFTANQTAESAFWKGHSSSPKLFDLVLRLRHSCER